MIVSGQVGRKNVLLHSVAALQLLILTIALTIRFWQWDFDDGFIVYRYVENIVKGHGWVYNLGEAYNASTSALNTIILALISYFGPTPAQSAHIVGGVSLFMIGLSLYAIFIRDASQWFALAVASLCVFMMANNFTWGLETNLFLGLLCLYIALEAYGITSWALLGVLVLVRPDALLLVGMRAILSLKEKTFPVRGIITVVLIVLPWAAFSLASFGNVFPATLKQKIWQGSSGYWGTGLIFLKGLFGYIKGTAFTHLAGVYWAPVILSVPLVLAPQGLLFCISRKNRILLMFAYVAAVLVAYTVLNVPNYHWYYVGFLLTTLVYAAYGVLFVVNASPYKIPPFKVINPLLVAAQLGIAIFLVSKAKVDFFDLRTDVYKRLSDKIVEQTPETADVAAVEVGVVGYYTRRKMIDIVGLTTPYGEFITGAKNEILFSQLKPQLIVMHNPLMPQEQSVYGDSEFSRNYYQRDLIITPGYPELSYFVRKQKKLSPIEVSLERVAYNHLQEVSPGVYRVNGEDPWIEYKLGAPQDISHPVLSFQYMLMRDGQPVNSNFIGRVYIRSEASGYTEERAFPMLLKGGAVQQANVMLSLPGSTYDNSQIFQFIRLDLVQDVSFAADITIEVSSMKVGRFVVEN